ncbi:hypothetical protein AJ85_18480 [Alkalihalobacillus alcalophilus ATCC 27647 = CGMCC 1.3604]|uniref:Uncharacterized protein n=1 Tax=Alkalihalobacillus alcalophilus ATCC 27647 = CGMCC 1.3604 TaxID=1218173 RepID=A0A4S4K068_ALKAL|nr:hypothetical protein AJ85_18480 [Alkalihalobacillus alcalophilus ATCC 27647 = CGMCC 1.3604]
MDPGSPAERVEYGAGGVCEIHLLQKKKTASTVSFASY